ncbi:MAG: terminase small subunit [Eubacteriales bacterium]
MGRINAKQKKFVDEYLIDLNATQAAIRAGYSNKCAGSIGEENLKKPEIVRVIDARMAELSKRTGVNLDRIVLELAKIAFFNITDVVNIDDATVKGDSSREDMACIASVKVKTVPTSDGMITEWEVKAYDKIKALELLGKHLGMFTDRVRFEGAIPVVIGGSDELED